MVCIHPSDPERSGNISVENYSHPIIRKFYKTRSQLDLIFINSLSVYRFNFHPELS